MYLHSTTCVGFLYGLLSIVSFWGYILSRVTPFKTPRYPLFPDCFRLPPSTLYTHLFSPFSYWLGTALPSSHHSSSAGTFGASAIGFLPHFFVTHVNILTPDRTLTQISPICLHAIQDTLLPCKHFRTHNRRFGHDLCLFYFRPNRS